MASIEKILVPDIGGAADVDVIEILVKKGDTVNVDDSLITLEGDKASMDVPSPVAGVIDEIHVKVGDKVSEGSLILTMSVDASAAPSSEKKAEVQKPAQQPAEKITPAPAVETSTNMADVHAGPAVRRIAREIGLSLSKVKGTGPKGRITKEDIKAYVQGKLAQAESGGFNFPPAPKVDFSKFGATETKALNKIRKMSGANLHRNWVSIPHVTQFDEADVTDMEAYRQRMKADVEKQGAKLTPLVFVMKAVIAALKKFPMFNASLDASGENLILKQYYHIGVAVDTPNGLVVPVIRDVDKKDVVTLAKELAAISEKARDKGLSLTDMQGGCFTISSLGGIGGTAFTPIINAPEVAILGVSKSAMKPVYQADGSLLPRLMLPLSLSYDHRVIDGADGARFIVYLSNALRSDVLS